MSNSYIGNPPPSTNQVQVLENPARNAIINGNFDIWQRGTLFTVPGFTADRWDWSNVSAATQVVAPSVDAPITVEGKSITSLKAATSVIDSSIATGDYSFVYYKMEGYDYARLAGGVATLSFWVKAPVTGIYCVSFRNTGPDRSYIAEYTIDVANTWQQIEVQVPLTETGGTWDYGSGKGLMIGFCIASGSTFGSGTNGAWVSSSQIASANQVNGLGAIGDFKLSRVQFERGNTATTFEFKSFADEMAHCQRYYEAGKVGSFQQVPAITGTRHANMVFLAVHKRVFPSVSIADMAGTVGVISIFSNTSAALTNGITAFSGDVRLNSFYVSKNQAITSYGIASYWNASAEL